MSSSILIEVLASGIKRYYSIDKNNRRSGPAVVFSNGAPLYVETWHKNWRIAVGDGIPGHPEPVSKESSIVTLSGYIKESDGRISSRTKHYTLTHSRIISKKRCSDEAILDSILFSDISDVQITRPTKKNRVGRMSVLRKKGKPMTFVFDIPSELDAWYSALRQLISMDRAATFLRDRIDQLRLDPHNNSEFGSEMTKFLDDVVDSTIINPMALHAQYSSGMMSLFFIILYSKFPDPDAKFSLIKKLLDKGYSLRKSGTVKVLEAGGSIADLVKEGVKYKWFVTKLLKETRSAMEVQLVRFFFDYYFERNDVDFLLKMASLDTRTRTWLEDTKGNRGNLLRVDKLRKLLEKKQEAFSTLLEMSSEHDKQVKVVINTYIKLRNDEIKSLKSEIQSLDSNIDGVARTVLELTAEIDALQQRLFEGGERVIEFEGGRENDDVDVEYFEIAYDDLDGILGALLHTGDQIVNLIEDLDVSRRFMDGRVRLDVDHNVYGKDLTKILYHIFLFGFHSPAHFFDYLREISKGSEVVKAELGLVLPDDLVIDVTATTRDQMEFFCRAVLRLVVNLTMSGNLGEVFTQILTNSVHHEVYFYDTSLEKYEETFQKLLTVLEHLVGDMFLVSNAWIRDVPVLDEGSIEIWRGGHPEMLRIEGVNGYTSRLERIERNIVHLYNYCIINKADVYDADKHPEAAEMLREHIFKDVYHLLSVDTLKWIERAETGERRIISSLFDILEFVYRKRSKEIYDAVQKARQMKEPVDVDKAVLFFAEITNNGVSLFELVSRVIVDIDEFSEKFLLPGAGHRYKEKLKTLMLLLGRIQGFRFRI